MKNKISSFLIALLLLFTTASPVFAAQSSFENNNNASKESADYFCIENTFYGEDVIDQLKSKTARDYFHKIETANSYTPYAVSSKEVFVEEKVSIDGTTLDSHLMTNKEVMQYMLHSSKTCSNGTVETKGNTYVGSDSENPSKKKLTLYLVVYKDNNRNYYAYGTADWTSNDGSGEYTPSAGDDFISMTWGSNKLKCTSPSVSGMYDDDTAISFDKEKSDSYGGFCWSFPEQEKWLIFETRYANYIDTYIKLSKVNSTYQKKETNIRMTYIHTYQSTVGSVSFEGGTQGVAATIGLSGCSKWWRLEIDVPNISY